MRTPKLTPAQQRRMQELADRIDRISGRLTGSTSNASLIAGTAFVWPAASSSRLTGYC